MQEPSKIFKNWTFSSLQILTILLLVATTFSPSIWFQIASLKCSSCNAEIVELLVTGANNLIVFGLRLAIITNYWIRVITKLPNSEQSYKGKVKTHKYINRHSVSTGFSELNWNHLQWCQQFNCVWSTTMVWRCGFKLLVCWRSL
jgi:hypothetical protein